MDPVSLIVAALVAGAARSAEGVAEQSLKDAYAGLKGLLRRFFQDKPAAEMVLEEHEKDPAAYEAPLEKVLQESGAAKDDQVLAQAKKLLAIAEPNRTPGDSYNIGNMKADRGGVVVARLQGNVQAGYNPAAGERPNPG